ncbi:hypothetical protein [Dactylosporangium sp. NPDC048998]|uniref:hypothetical protein n=1 Tax=Dactylosporangium sp. NPDC048998 TaxID=3363976 RepID=UPI003724334D
MLRIFEQLASPSRDAEDRRRAALDQARAAYIEAEQGRHFVDQVRRWRLAPHAAAFLEATRTEIASRAAHGHDVTAAQQWLAWAERYVADLDPLRGELGLPPVTAPSC